MDAYDNQEKYKDYLIRLEAAKENIQIDESLRLVLNESEEILLKIKSLSDAELYKNLNLGLNLIGAVVFIIHVLFFGYWAGILGLLVIVFFYVSNKIIIDRQILIVNESSKFSELEGVITEEAVILFRKYILNGIELKLKRFQILRMMIASILSLILISGVELILSRIGLLEIILGFILGSFFWFFYFKPDIDDLIFMKEKVEKDIRIY